MPTERRALPARRGLRVALPSFAAMGLAALAAEVALRGRVPHCGVTPFRGSTIEGVCWELRSGFRTLYRGVPVRINSSGFRGEEFPAPREGVPRVALIGDSMVFGNGVPFEDTLAARLEGELARAGVEAQVLGCGVPGHGADDVARTLPERVLPLEPDLVVYVFFANDLEDRAPPDEIPPDSVLDAFQGYPLRSAFLEWAKTRAKHVLQRAGVATAKRTPQWSRREYELGRDTFLAALRSMEDRCASSDAGFFVAAYPFLCPPRVDPFAPIVDRAEEDCAALGIDFLRLSGAFEEGEDLTPYRVSAFDPHPAGAANARVAERLADEVLARLGRAADALPGG